MTESDPNGHVRLHVLGAIDLRRADGGAVRSVLAQPKRLGLLTYLAVSASDSFQPRTRLLGLLWPDREERSARDNLNRSVSFLRQALGPGVITGRGEQELGVDTRRLWCDAVAFRRAASEDRLEDALELYRGALLEGLVVGGAREFHDWLDSARVTFEREAIATAWKRVDRLVAAGDLRSAIDRARWVVDRAPFDEGAHRRLMELKGMAGERAKALRVYERLEARLASELETEPSPETRRLMERIRRPGERGDSPGPASPDASTVTGGAARGGGESAADAGGPATADRPEGRGSGAEAAASRGAGRGAAAALAIAVLPFDRFSTDADPRAFGEGLVEDAITHLAKIEGLRVVAASVVRRAAASASDARAIAEELGVDLSVEGSIRRHGTKVRVAVRLVEAGSGNAVWAETYQRELEDPFAVQAELASRIADATAAALAVAEPGEPADHQPTRNAVAYELYLRGRFAWTKRTPDDLARSVRCLEASVSEDPDFALAHAALADTYVMLGTYGVAAPAEAFGAARAAADRALEIEPDLAEALVSRGCVRASHDWDWERAESDFRRAVALHPAYPTAHQWRASQLLIPLGRFAEARASLERAWSLDPFSLAVTSTFAVLAYYQREFDRAVEECRRVIEREPDFATAHFFLGQALLQLGEHDDAIAALEAAVRHSDGNAESVAALGHACAVAGREADAREWAGELSSRAEDQYVSPVLLALVALGFGDIETALDRLEEAHELRAADLIWIGQRAVFDPLREEPRFRAMRERIGLPPGPV